MGPDEVAQRCAARDGVEQRCAVRDGVVPRSVLPGAQPRAAAEVQPCAAEAQPFLAVVQPAPERAAGPMAQAFSGLAQMLRLRLARGKQELTRTDEP